MRGLGSAIAALLGAALLLSGCAAISNLPGAILIYTREMTDLEGQDTVVRGYLIADPDLFETENIDESVNYAAAKLDYATPTYLLVFQSLPGPSISHTSYLSLALPLLAQELCGERPVTKADRELDWGTGNRNIYVECQPLPAGQDIASADVSAAAAPPSEDRARAVLTPDPDYILRYRVIYDANGDTPNASVSILPSGQRILSDGNSS